ncbi:MAG: metallophosphoesterase [Gammaproteobacteria bacterium]|nr:metallophosphoesterase [Gammaproteobacteria bacterium]
MTLRVVPASPLFQPLFAGPLDIVGDVHGELTALRALLDVLGYRADGSHPHGRRLVFIGDLGDRGEDSPGVFALVQDLVGRGRAQCLLGNHELNLLRGAVKEGNGWFHATDHDHAEGRFLTARRASAAGRDAILAFLASLPLVLERADLRLVHAAWDDAAINLLRECRGDTPAIYRAYAGRATEVARQSGLAARAAAEWQVHGAQLRDPAATLPLLEHVGRLDALYQMANPVRILTSGPEALAAEPFYASGKWRMLDRVRWWTHYRHTTPVLVGHYWRWASEAARAAFSRGEHDLFDGTAWNAWHGAQRNVYCLDFGVGARYRERATGRRDGFHTRLGAVRWPEREVVTDEAHRAMVNQ